MSELPQVGYTKNNHHGTTFHYYLDQTGLCFLRYTLQKLSLNHLPKEQGTHGSEWVCAFIT